MIAIPQIGHSAKIEAFLHVGGHKLRISRVGRGSLMLHEWKATAPATEATVIVTVDGVEQRMPIVLVNGISATNVDVPFIEQQS